MPTRTNPSPRPLVLPSGRVLASGETADVSERDADTPAVLTPTDPEPVQVPAGNAGTEVWAAYAASIEVAVPEGATRDQIKAAVAAHHEES